MSDATGSNGVSESALPTWKDFVDLLDVRIRNNFKRSLRGDTPIESLSDLLSKSRNDLLMRTNFGIVSLNKVRKMLGEFGLHLSDEPVANNFIREEDESNPQFYDDKTPLTIGEFRKGLYAITEVLKSINGAKYFKRVESDGCVVSYGADTLDELRAMIGEPIDQPESARAQ